MHCGRASTLDVHDVEADLLLHELGRFGCQRVVSTEQISDAVRYVSQSAAQFIDRVILSKIQVGVLGGQQQSLNDFQWAESFAA